MKKIVALFDIDKTLLPGYSLIDFAFFLESHKHFKQLSLEKMEKGIEHYKQGQLTYNQFADIAISLYAEGLEGEKVDRIQKLSTQFWDNRFKTIFTFVIPLFKELKALKSQCVAISGSSKESLNPLFTKLHFDQTIVTEINENNGVFVNSVKINAASHDNKSRLIQNLLQTINLEETTLIGFGDSVADLSFLSLVNFPFVVGEHDIELNLVARKNNWNIIQNPNKSFSIKKLL